MHCTNCGKPTDQPQQQQQTQPSEPEMPRAPKKKRLCKLPIVLGAIAVILLVMLAVSLGEEKKNPDTAQTVRYDSQGFLFTPEEFSGIYLETLARENIPFTLGELRKKVEYNYGYPILYQEEEIGLLLASISQGSEKCSGVSVTYDFQGDEIIDQYAMKACVSLFTACLGTVTDAQWQYINDMEPSYQDAGVICYNDTLEGFTVMMNLWADRIHLDIFK